MNRNQRPCRPEHIVPIPEKCGLCNLFINNPKYAAAWAVGETESPFRTAIEPALSPSTKLCGLEGPVVEYAPCQCEQKHVRQCLYDGPDDRYGDRCVRGLLSAEIPGIRSCQLCPHKVE